jgi:hypothetical protein
MLAAPGFLIAEQFHPLFGGSIDVPSYIAFQSTPLQTFWPLVVFGIGLIEIATSVPTMEDPAVKLYAMKPGRIPGDLGFFGGTAAAKANPAAFKSVQTKEINNGRLAMLGIAGMVAQVRPARARARHDHSRSKHERGRVCRNGANLARTPIPARTHIRATPTNPPPASCCARRSW